MEGYMVFTDAHMAVPTSRLHRSKVGGTKTGERCTFTQEELYRFIEKHCSRVID